jgi:hypothetical protein
MMLDDSGPMVQSAWQLQTPSFLQQLWLPWLQLPPQPLQPDKGLPVSILGPYLETSKSNPRLSI